MRHVFKITGNVLSAMILLLIFLPMLAALLLEIPAVQNYVVRKAAAFASEKLGTRVAIDRVELGLFYRATVKGFYVEDFQRDTLLYVGRLDARLGSLRGGLTFSSATLRGGKFRLNETPDGTMNIKQIVDKMVDPNKPKKGDFKLTIEELKVEGLDFYMERLAHRDPSYGVDYGDMQLLGIRGDLRNFSVEGSTVTTGVDRLSFRERSGFTLDELSTDHLQVAGGNIVLQNTRITTPRSRITMPELAIEGESWSRYKYFVDSVRLTARVVESSLSSDDVAFFAPSMRSWHLRPENITAEMKGTVDDFEARLHSLRTGETSLAGDFTITGLPDIRKAHFDAPKLAATTTASDIERIMRSITGKSLPDGARKIIAHAGSIDLAGDFRGSLASFTAHATAASPLGELVADAAFFPHADGQEIKSTVHTTDFSLNRLLDNNTLGRLSLTARVEGTLGKTTDARLDGVIEKLEANGYTYRDVRFDGRMQGKAFEGRVDSRDENLRFDLAGLLDLSDPELPNYDFTLDLDRANLAALGINRRDSVSLLSAHMVARARGRTIDDLNGSVVISEATYRYNARELSAGNITIEGRNTPTDKYIRLGSRYADATYEGKTPYKELFAYLRHRGRDYLPHLTSPEAGYAVRPDTLPLADSYNTLTVDLKEITPLTDAIATGLQVANGSQLHLRVDPVSDDLTLRAHSDYIEQGGILATRIDVNARNRGDSLVLTASTDDLFAAGLRLSHLAVHGGVRDNRLAIEADFADSLTRTTGHLGLRSAFGGVPSRIDVRLTPSYITFDRDRWQITSGGVELGNDRVRIDRFRLSHAAQELVVDGIASRELGDSIRVTLHDFDLSPLSNLLASTGYTVDGRANGYAMMRSALKNGRLSADISLDSLRLNDLAGPALRLRSRWDREQNRAGMILQKENGLDTLIRGFYAPQEGRYYARATLKGMDVGLLDPILKGVITRTRGTADADVTFRGENGTSSLTGRVALKDFTTTVDYTKVAYTIPEAVLTVENSHLIAREVPLYDPERNQGLFSMDLNLEHFSNISYSVEVKPDRMQVLGTTSKDNDLFYGKVYASGAATITGDKAGVKMDITARTENNSAFYMPLSGNSSVKRMDFVKFVAPTPAGTTDYLLRRKLLFQNRNAREKSAEAGGSMEISMNLDVRDNTAFQLVIDPTVGDIIKGRGNGQLNLRVNPQNNVFEMRGDYVLTEGNYLFTFPMLPVSKWMRIEPGSAIRWTGDPVDALLDMTAVHSVRASLRPLLDPAGTGEGVSDRAVPVECGIHIGGRLSEPQLTFSVNVPTSDVEIQAEVDKALGSDQTAQFAYLVLFNSFMPENLMAGNTGLGASTASATGLELISSQLTNWLSGSDYRILFNYHPGTELTGDELDFGFSTNLINNRLLIEVEGNYVIDNKQVVASGNVSNFMGEAHVTWLIDKAGDLRLKVFTQTIDRFDENQGLQETGVGISYKEDFDNLKDLRQRIRTRFRKDPRRKADRRAAREERRNVQTTTNSNN